MTITGRTAAPLLGAVLLIALVGCSPAPAPPATAPVPSGTDLPAPDPAPTDVAAVATAPNQRIDVLCPDLLSDAQLDSLFGRNAVGLKYVEMEAAISWPAIPQTYAVRQLGGMACEWSNGVARSDRTGTAAAYRGVRITYVPDARAEWDVYAGIYAPPGTRDLHCSSYSDVSCNLNSLVGNGWLEIAAYGMLPGTEAAAVARFTPPVDAIEAALLAGTISPDVWAPPAGTIAMPSDCGALVSNAAVGAAVGLGPLVTASGPHGGWSIEAGAARMVAESSCSWLFTGSDAGVGSMQWIPGGEWALNDLRSYVFDPAVGAFEALAVTGLATGDNAWVRCSAGNAVCVADLVIGGNWINIYLWPDYTAATDRRTAITTIATAVVDSLR